MSITDEINAISDKVFALEQENERLKQQLTEHPPDSPTVEKIIRLLGEMDTHWGPRMDTLPRGEVRLIELYREIVKERDG